MHADRRPPLNRRRVLAALGPAAASRRLVYVRLDARGRPAERAEGFALKPCNLWLLKKVH